MSIRKRLAGTFASNGFGFVVTMTIQLGSVPILLGAWGPSLYGEWLLVSTIPAYLAMSDLGLTSALANDMSLSTARGDRLAAVAAFQSIGLAMLALGPVLLLPLSLLAAMFPMTTTFGMTSISVADLPSLIALLFAQFWLSQQGGILQAGFRSAGYWSLPNALTQTLRIVEFGALATVAIAGGGPVPAVAAMVVIRMAGTVLAIALLRIYVPWLTLGVSQARFALVQTLLRPGVMFLALPVANALNVQTPLLLVGAMFGSQATVLFSTSRTISRTMLQLVGVINSSIWPAVSHAFGTGDLALVRRVFRIAVAVSLWLSAAGAVSLALGGPLLYRLWTHKLISFDPILLYILLMVVLANGFWSTASVIFTATNRHAGLAICYLLVNLAVVPLCWLLGLVAGLHGIAFSLIIGEVLVVLYVIPASLRLAGDQFSTFARFLFSPISIGTAMRRERR